MARCGRCRIPTYEPVQSDRVYQVAMTAFLIEGGDGYSVFTTNIIERRNYGTINIHLYIIIWVSLWDHFKTGLHLHRLVVDILGIAGYEAIAQYMQMRGAPFTIGLEARINFCNASKE